MKRNIVISLIVLAILSCGIIASANTSFEVEDKDMANRIINSLDDALEASTPDWILIHTKNAYETGMLALYEGKLMAPEGCNVFSENLLEAMAILEEVPQPGVLVDSDCDDYDISARYKAIASAHQKIEQAKEGAFEDHLAYQDRQAGLFIILIIILILFVLIAIAR